jgi:hypothetical protein
LYYYVYSDGKNEDAHWWSTVRENCHAYAAV